MSSNRLWTFRVKHILNCIERIQEYTRELDLESFSINQIVIDAVIRNFQVIGEAARLMPEEVQSAHPEIPWRDMQKMRHVLVHDYDKVDHGKVWLTIQNDLPPLVQPLKDLLLEQ
jgi:uncharacterized protein with HEPN domain